ncbi:Sec-independent protein translocase protein TatB [Marinobacteraceae bacterium S3BR75-40.1]
MFDIGFLELVLCAILALLVLGPERLPGAARTAGRWIGRARRMTRQFTDELDRQVRAEEIRERIRKERSEVGFDDIQRNFQEGLSKAREYEHMLVNKDLAPPEDTVAGKDPTAPAESQSDKNRSDG